MFLYFQVRYCLIIVGRSLSTPLLSCGKLICHCFLTGEVSSLLPLFILLGMIFSWMSLITFPSSFQFLIFWMFCFWHWTLPNSFIPTNVVIWLYMISLFILLKCKIIPEVWYNLAFFFFFLLYDRMKVVEFRWKLYFQFWPLRLVTRNDAPLWCWETIPSPSSKLVMRS